MEKYHKCIFCGRFMKKESDAWMCTKCKIGVLFNDHFIKTASTEKQKKRVI